MMKENSPSIVTRLGIDMDDLPQTITVVDKPAPRNLRCSFGFHRPTPWRDVETKEHGIPTTQVRRCVDCNVAMTKKY